VKKNSIVLTIYLIIAVVYAALSLILTVNKNSVFWTGFGFVIFAIAVMGLITAISANKKTSAFPIEVSMVAFSGIYVAVVLCINIICDYILKANINMFISIHILCLALFAATTLLMFTAKSSIIKQNSAVNSRICEMQVLIYEFEKIKTKLIDMQGDVRKNAMTLIDSLLDDLRFSDFGVSVDVSDIDNKLRSKAENLSSEVDNLISIKSDDLSSMESMVNDIVKIIKDRNMQIRLMGSNI
jgi:predicted RNA-binding protein Jag